MDENELRLNALIKALSDQREAAYNLLAKSTADAHVLEARLQVQVVRCNELTSENEKLKARIVEQQEQIASSLREKTSSVVSELVEEPDVISKGIVPNKTSGKMLNAR